MYRIIQGGIRVDEAGPLLKAEFRSPILHEIVTVTGTQLQSGTITPMIILGPFPGRVVPIAWSVYYHPAGGTLFTVNTTLQLTNSNGEPLGEATNAISAAGDYYVTGSIISGPMYDN